VKKLAVVVLNWNGLADTRALLPTLLACRMPADWTLEPIVVDKNNVDATVIKDGYHTHADIYGH